MRSGASLALICAGAILAFAVTANTSFLNLHTAGYVLIIIGIVGLYFNRRGWSGRHLLVRRTRAVPGATEERVVPKYVMRNPGAAPLRAGLPSVPSIADPAEGEQQPIPGLPPDGKVVEEEFYED
jgi:hypothetical protein